MTSAEHQGRCPQGHPLHPGVPVADCARCATYFGVLETKEHGVAVMTGAPDPDTVAVEPFPYVASAAAARAARR